MATATHSNELVFTNGIFDLLHVGHIRLLQFARGQGNRLIVGINSDASARRLKGSSRPIIPAEQRREILLALSVVDEVRIFGEDTPEHLILDLRPHTLVKGPEAARKPIPGADLVRSWGGRVLVPQWTVAASTTQLVRLIRMGDPLQPWPVQQRLMIGDVDVVPSPRHQITWRADPDGPRPVLYDHGRRCIEPWQIQLAHCQPADPYGRSA